MSVIRVGSTTDYAVGWENIFGSERKAAKKSSTNKKRSVKKAAVKKTSPKKKQATKKKVAKKKASAKKENRGSKNQDWREKGKGKQEETSRQESKKEEVRSWPPVSSVAQQDAQTMKTCPAGYVMERASAAERSAAAATASARAPRTPFLSRTERPATVVPPGLLTRSLTTAG